MADQSLGTLGQAPGATLAPRVLARPRKIRGSEVGRRAVSSQWIGQAGVSRPKFDTPKLIARCSLEPSRCYPAASWLCIYPNGRNGTHPTTINGLARSR